MKSFILALILISWAYWVVACWLIWRLMDRQKGPVADFHPPVSMLKPVMGLDYQMYENFVSMVQQDYPEFELLFGVADASDPAVAVVEQLQRDYPQHHIRLMVAPPIAVNRKASILHTLAAHATHPILVVNDSDMRVTPDYLRRVVAPLADERVGLVTCPYRGSLPLTLTARMEALYVGVSFMPGTVVGRRLGISFGLGATMALRRHDLERIGGFAAVADYLADDYQIGARIGELGLTVCLSDYLVDNVIGTTTLREQWHREVRWARCTRVSQPVGYPGLLLTFTVPLTLLLVAATRGSPLSLLILGISLAWRWAAAWLITAYTDNRAIRRWLGLLPLREMLSALVWIAGALGRRVEWRGIQYAVTGDGRLQRRPWHNKPPVANYLLAARLIRALDALLRRIYQVTEFTQDPEAMLRLSLATAERDLVLSDGTHIRAGDPVAMLHFWNEHIPVMPPDGPDLGWGLAFQRGLSRSLQDVAAHVQTDPAYRQVRALRGPTTFTSAHDPAEASRIVGRWGFDLLRRERKAGFWPRFGLFWESVYASWLIWAYNPPSARSKPLRSLRWDELWMSRERLLAQYQPRRAASEPQKGIEPRDTRNIRKREV